MHQRKPASYQLTKRARTLLYVLGGVIVIYWVYGSWFSQPPVTPPMPGTYQYFREKDFHHKSHLFGGVSHYDPRFAPKIPLTIAETKESLLSLLNSYALTMDDLKIETWIAHGALLGWYWNRKLMPWDTDIDVQMPYKDLEYLARSFNMSEYEHRLSHAKRPRKFLLEINPFSSIISTKDVANKIDARWIDMTTGKSIDITATHVDSPNLHDNTGMLWCKDGHMYSEKDIFPLVSSMLNGKRVKIPANPAKVLEEEYGPKALTNDRFHWHRFNHETKEWEPE